jgi:hypothetical protein
MKKIFSKKYATQKLKKGSNWAAPSRDAKGGGLSTAPSLDEKEECQAWRHRQ